MLSNMDLHSETLRLMAVTNMPVTRICDECGVTTRWYYMVRSGEIETPGYQRLQRVHDYLKQHNGAAA